MPINGNRGDEGGWKLGSGFESPKVVGADANYYNRAHWKITPQGGGKYLIENVVTKRYLFQDGRPISGNRGSDGGWLSSPNTVGADANYYNLAHWRILPQGNNKYFIENVETRRYLFQGGAPLQGERGVEKGWTGSPEAVGADANYYNRAYYKLVKV